jgi:hypothetical protein
LKRIFSSFDRIAVYHARNLLEAAGIRAVVKNEFLSSAMGELPPAECQMELWILADADQSCAEQVLKIPDPPPARGSWHCRCGEAQEPQFTHCWSCGAVRP